MSAIDTLDVDCVQLETVGFRMVSLPRGIGSESSRLLPLEPNITKLGDLGSSERMEVTPTRELELISCSHSRPWSIRFTNLFDLGYGVSEPLAP